MSIGHNVLETHSDSWPRPGGPQDVFAKEDPNWPLPRIVRGDDIYLFDEAGNRYIDFSSGPVASNLGHNNRRIIELIKEQAEKLCFAQSRVARTDENIALADKLTEVAGIGYERAFFVSGGSEAIDTSVKFARQWAYANGDVDRTRMITLMPSYHGGLISTIGLGGDEVPIEVFRGMTTVSEKIPAPLTYRPPEGMTQEENEDRIFALFSETLERVGPKNILAFMYEPVGGVATGCNVLSNRFLKLIRETCDQHGILMIADEVMAGAGRTGKFLAAHHTPDGRPDLIVLAKGIGAGYTPLGIMLAPSRMVDRLAKLTGYPYGHTAAANPLSCAIGLAALEETLERDLINNAETVGKYLQERLWALSDEIPVIGDVRGRGLLLATEVVSDRATKARFPKDVAAPDIIRRLAFNHGLTIYGRRTNNGKFGDWIMSSPPLITTPDQVDEIVERFGATLKDFVDEAVRAGAKIA
jgi:adenosylmethionine-8-amino-7-oxononanoate aminotransferase